MQAIRQGGWLRRSGPWRIVGVAAAVIAAAALAYPALSSTFNAPSTGSAVTIRVPDPPVSAFELKGSVPVSTAGTSTAGTGPAAVPQVTTSPATAGTSKNPAGTAGKTAAGTGPVAKTPAGSGAAPAKAGSGSASAPLAGRIKPGETRRGVATFYQGAQNTGACLFDRSPDHFTAAMNQADYEGSNACGAYVQVRGSSGATITVRITNLCPSPCRVGQLDLDPEAYKLLAPLQTGETPITWKLVSPNISGGIAIRYKVGSSQWWCGIQVINHRNPVARLEVKAGGAWKALPRTDYNYFLSEKGAGCGGGIRVTDVYGQSLVVGPFPVKPDVTQTTGVQFAKH